MSAAEVDSVVAVECLDADERDAIARGLAASLHGTAARLGQPTERRWWRIVVTESFDAWLIDWPAQGSVRPHDHGGAAASICVIRGELVESVFQGDGVAQTVLAEGSTHRVSADAVHDVTNRGPAPATSVHVYSPPLRTMGFYDESGEPVGWDVIDAEPTLWSTVLPGSIGS